jgi:hypothetical protein
MDKERLVSRCIITYIPPNISPPKRAAIVYCPPRIRIVPATMINGAPEIMVRIAATPKEMTAERPVMARAIPIRDMIPAPII